MILTLILLQGSAASRPIPDGGVGGFLGKDKYILRLDKDGKYRLKKLVRKKVKGRWVEYEVDADPKHTRAAMLAFRDFFFE